MFAITSRPTAFRLEVANQGCGLVANRVTGLTPTERKFSLITISYAYKVIIKSTQRQSKISRHGKITSNKIKALTG